MHSLFYLNIYIYLQDGKNRLILGFVREGHIYLMIIVIVFVHPFRIFPDVFDHFSLFVVSIIVLRVCVVVKFWSTDIYFYFLSY